MNISEGLDKIERQKKCMSVSKLIEEDFQDGKITLTGIVKGLQTSRIYDYQLPVAGAIHYVAFLFDENYREDEKSMVLIRNSIDGYFGDEQTLTELSMLRASSETNLPVTIHGEIITTKPYQIMVSKIEFGEYNNKKKIN